MIRRSALRCTVFLAAAAAAGLFAGCTTSGHPEGAPDTLASAAPTTPNAPATTPPSTPPPSSAPATTATTATTATSTAPPSSKPATTSATTAAAPQTTCTALSVRVLQGGAVNGAQIAAIQFTNEGPAKCVLAGYPTVTLLLNGRVIGQPSQPASGAKSVRTLRPGDVAESLLRDYTQSCQAPLSDSVRVQVPGTGQTVVRPGMQLRACVLRVDKLSAPD